MNTIKSLAIVAALASTATLVPAEADACSCIFECKNTILTGSTLASGAEGFYWFLAGSGVAPGDIPDGVLTLEKLGADGDEVVPYVISKSNDRGTYFLIKPEAGFEVGSSYRFTADLSGWDGSGCAFEISSGKIEEVVSVETEIIEVVPTSKLTLAVGDITVDSIGFESEAVCSEDFLSAHRVVSIELPPDLEPLADSLFYDITVDGESYLHIDSSCAFQDILPNELDQTVRSTLLATICEDVPDYAGGSSISQGTHEVIARAKLPESDVFSWKSDPVMIDLNCPEPTIDPDAGPSDPDAGPIDADPDVGSPDAGSPSPDGGSDGSGGDSQSEGCVQASPGAPAGAPGALALALLGLVGLGRRRR